MLFNKKIVLISNYLPDKQESMKLFALMFYDIFEKNKIEVEIWYPTVFFGKFLKNNNGLSKWFAYIDKYILFPLVLILKRIVNIFNEKECVFHICDHSNSPYIYFLPNKKTVITCHDVLAIRGALGYKDAYCEASSTGKILQELILNSLFKANKIAFVSNYTRQQFIELKKIKSVQNLLDHSSYKVIYNGFNFNFKQLDIEKTRNTFNTFNITITSPYIFHVGSNLPRKNRTLLVEMLNLLKDSWDGIVCFAGHSIDIELQNLINKYGLEKRVISIVKPKHELLIALYNGAEALVFPSFSEGFGWPLIEAQACGIPVITSNIEPMYEVCGGAAIHADPNCPEEFVKAFKSLSDKITREGLIKKGLINCERFEKEKILNSYLKFYNQ